MVKDLAGLPWGIIDKRIHPPMLETLVSSLGQEDPLEQERDTHSTILAWKIPRTEEPGRVHGVAKGQT